MSFGGALFVAGLGSLVISAWVLPWAGALSLAQRELSTPARYVRRTAPVASVEFGAGERPWRRERLLGTWELPLKLLTGTVVLFAGSLLLKHV